MYNNVPLDESGLTACIGRSPSLFIRPVESCDATRGRSKPRRDAYLSLNGVRPYISGSTLPHLEDTKLLHLTYSERLRVRQTCQVWKIHNSSTSRTARD